MRRRYFIGDWLLDENKNALMRVCGYNKDDNHIVEYFNVHNNVVISDYGILDEKKSFITEKDNIIVHLLKELDILTIEKANLGNVASTENVTFSVAYGKISRLVNKNIDLLKEMNNIFCNQKIKFSYGREHQIACIQKAIRKNTKRMRGINYKIQEARNPISNAKVRSINTKINYIQNIIKFLQEV